MISSRRFLFFLLLISGLLALTDSGVPGGEEKTAAREKTGAGAVPGESVPEGPEKIKQPESYLDFAVAGGPLMIPIAICSILWLAFLVERLAATRRSRVVPTLLVQALKSYQGSGDPDRSRARSMFDAHPSTAASVLKVALRKIDQPRQELELAVNGIARKEVRILKRYTRLFAGIASVAPLLGLLGTVLGIIQAFREVADKGMGAGEYLAPGIYMALVTTAAGLLVAIPSLITYLWLSARVDSYVHEIDSLVMDFVDGGAEGETA